MSECKYSKKCSGCQLQNLSYAEQLHLKQVKVINLIGRLCHVEEIIGMENPYSYRNKSQTIFGVKSGKTISGIYQSTTKGIVEVDSCMIENEDANKICQTIKKLLSSFKIKPYDLKTQTGFLRHVLVRKGFNTGEILVVLVTTKGEFKSSRSFVNELVRRHPEITSVVWNINTSNTPLLLGEKCEVLYGKGYIIEKICGLSFRISPRSFFQVNTTQAEILYNKAKEFASLTGKETVIDAYCGTGTIGLSMASLAKRITGVELNKDAVKDAKENARTNKIENAEFYANDAGKFMLNLAENNEKIDVVVTDPPRAGCSIAFLKSVQRLSPKKIVYISCNPETLARDLRFLTKNDYRITMAQPVDLFPYTNHVEVIVALVKNV